MTPDTPHDPSSRRKWRKKLEKKVGASPGSLLYVGEEPEKTQRFELVDYSSEHIEESEKKEVESLLPFKESGSVTWINVVGLQDVERIGEIGKQFGLHPLLIEDILNTEHRPKFEHHGDQLFLTLKMIDLVEDPTDPIQEEQISLVLGKNYVLSFQEKEGDVFDTIRTRLRNKKGLIRNLGPDHLFYALLDAIVDHYFLVIDRLDESIEKLDNKIVNDPEAIQPQEIRELKKEAVQLRKNVAPLREAVGTLMNSETELISERTGKYFRDVHDHMIAVVSSLETQRELVSDLMDSYMSLLSVKMNNIMKVLTIIASIFIPLTFIAGIYGMNFETMPELVHPWGYPAVLSSMFLIAMGMIVYFQRRGWF